MRSAREHPAGLTDTLARTADALAGLVERTSRGLIPARFVLFAGVGASGVGVHLAVLSALKIGAGLSLAAAQAGAILVAMASNFLLNNTLTYRDRRLQGVEIWRGLGLFCLSCAGGAVASELVATGLGAAGAHWAAAGVAGAGAGAVWNFWSTRRTVWGEGTPASAEAVPTA